MEPDSDHEKISEIPLADYSGDELLRRWKAGEEQAASVLVDRYAIRLAALVANRMNRRYRDLLDPEDVVQSALGSFFHAAFQNRIQISQSVSLWRLLATFGRRKLMRSIERHAATKRGGDLERLLLADLAGVRGADAGDDQQDQIEELIADLKRELSLDQANVLDRLLAGQTQKEIATALNLNERTVRRRVADLRKLFSSQTEADKAEPWAFISPSLPRVDYREFVLGKLIGSGGFGKVYKAAMQTDGSIVAVKFLRKRFWRCDEAKQTFLREIDQASRISHPAIIRYLGWGESPHGGPYVVARWVDGLSLAEQPSVSADRFLKHLMQICLALKAIHATGIVHGDLTPNNVLITKSGQVVITDFGFSQSIDVSDDGDRAEFPATSPIGGTLGFAAPEQVSPAFGRVGPSTDIYAVGGLAYWFLSGRAPHDHGTAEASLAHTIASEDVELKRQQSDFRELAAIKRIANLALRKTITERPSIADLMADEDR